MNNKEKSKCCGAYKWRLDFQQGRCVACGKPFIPEEEPRVDYSHSHCWNQKQPPDCGQPLDKHTQCCLCDLRVPEVKEEEWKCPADNGCQVECDCDRKITKEVSKCCEKCKGVRNDHCVYYGCPCHHKEVSNDQMGEFTPKYHQDQLSKIGYGEVKHTDGICQACRPNLREVSKECCEECYRIDYEYDEYDRGIGLTGECKNSACPCHKEVSKECDCYNAGCKICREKDCGCSDQIELKHKIKDHFPKESTLPHPENWAARLSLYGKVSQKHAEEIDEIITNALSQAITEAKEEAWDEYKNTQGNVPMGVSQWRNHGEKYGYDTYFIDQAITTERNRVVGIIEGMPKEIKDYLFEIMPEKYWLFTGFNRAVNEIKHAITNNEK